MSYQFTPFIYSELQVLTDCHRAKAMFAMKPFLSHLDRILQKVTRIYEGGSPLSWYQGMQQAPELHMALLGLDAYIQDLLHNHLVMVDLASPAQGTQWLTGLLMCVRVLCVCVCMCVCMCVCACVRVCECV